MLKVIVTVRQVKSQGKSLIGFQTMCFIIILHIKNGNQYSQNDLGVRKVDKKCAQVHVICVLVIMHFLLC